jgi:hypothetical protein
MRNEILMERGKLKRDKERMHGESREAEEGW